jgi:UDP-N-acetylmuramate dehydrogenase
MRDRTDYSLLKHNTFGIDAHCRRFVEFSTIEEAREVAALLQTGKQPFLIIGGGSNLLLTGDFEGTVVHSAIRGVEPTVQPDGTVLLRVGSGEVWDEVVALCVEHGWHGAENLSLIPGEVGASAVQNIGAYGVEASHIIYKVEAVDITDAQTVTIEARDCQYGYRYSRFKGEWRNRYLITHVSTMATSATRCVKGWPTSNGERSTNPLPRNCAKPSSTFVVRNCPTPPRRAMPAASS